MRKNGAERPLLVLVLGSVAALAVLLGESRIGSVQPEQTCTPKVCSVLFPMHPDGARMAGSGNAVVFHTSVTLISVIDDTVRFMVGAHSIKLPVNVAGSASGLTLRVQELNDADATVIINLTPGGPQPGNTAR